MRETEAKDLRRTSPCQCLSLLGEALPLWCKGNRYYLKFGRLSSVCGKFLIKCSLFLTQRIILSTSFEAVAHVIKCSGYEGCFLLLCRTPHCGSATVLRGGADRKKTCFTRQQMLVVSYPWNWFVKCAAIDSRCDFTVSLSSLPRLWCPTEPQKPKR